MYKVHEKFEFDQAELDTLAQMADAAIKIQHSHITLDEFRSLLTALQAITPEINLED